MAPAGAASPSAAAPGRSSSSSCWRCSASTCPAARARSRSASRSSRSELSSTCRTGDDANQREDCRIVGVVNSVQDYWSERAARATARRRRRSSPARSRPRCGGATSAVGPFYCPGDETVYIDLGFYEQLRTQFGARGGPFAQAYVIGHEYGHHVQHLIGTDQRVGATARARRRTRCGWSCRPTATRACGPRTPSRPGSSRSSRQADIADGLDAAAAIGDDRIQEQATGRVDPESWTHGSSASRQKWFETGYRSGDPAPLRHVRRQRPMRSAATTASISSTSSGATTNSGAGIVPSSGGGNWSNGTLTPSRSPRM